MLEQRVLLSGNPASQVAVTDLVRYTSGAVGPQALGTQLPTGYTPTQIRHAYGFDQISFNGTAGNGAGTTIAIVDAYDDPNIANDLQQFDLAFGLQDPPSFTKVNQLGQTSNLPVANAGWITEIALDVEWAHAVAPGASILLVEANSNSDSDLFTSVNTARNHAGVDVVSMSWFFLDGEYSSETSDDIRFTTPGGHAGVTFVACSGDSGAPPSYPSASPNVLSVGGTTLNLDASGNWISETSWSGSGGGISAYEAQPSYQKGFVTQTATFRSDPDVAYDANPSTGFPVYDSYNNGTRRPWTRWGGTSDATPQWAALIAIADQGRALAGEGSLDGATQTLPILYGMSANDFHDITSGVSTGSPQYSAGPGYDLVTGRGTPFANLVVNDLINVAPTLTAVSTLGPAHEQTPFNISYITLLSASNAQDADGNTIQFRIMAVQNGAMTVTHSGVTTAVVAGSTLLGPGDTLTWTGNAGITGSSVTAFTVVASDGTLSSTPAVPVQLNVDDLGAAFDLSGVWTVEDTSGTPLGQLASITQTGANLALTNASSVGSTGQYATFNQIVVPNFNGPSTVTATGTVDTSTADNGRIVWRDGSGTLLAVWLRNSLAGEYSVLTPGSATLTLASITQTGTQLTLVNGSSTTSAAITSPTALQVGAATATFRDGTISFSNNGQVWTKLDLPPDYTNARGAPTHVMQNGTSLTFVDSLGDTSPGYWTSPTQLFATAWNEPVTVALGKLLWQDGSIWSENLVLNGSQNGSGTTTIAATPSQLYVFDYVNGSGKPVHLVLSGTTNVIFVDSLGHMSLGTTNGPTQATTPYFPGDIATIATNAATVVWSDGTVWTQTAATSAITVTNYTNASGVPVHLIQNGSNQLVFVDSLGRTSLGTLQSPTTALADLYPGDVATISGNTVSWQDGSFWTQTNAVPLTITLIDANGAVSHVQLTSLTTLVGLDGPLKEVQGTRNNGNINWSNGVVWNEFDFNALNALFQMGTGYP